jgi:uncharacterized protein YPO0396
MSRRASTALIGHFEDLNRAHEAVLKAKRQVEMLEPLVADCERTGNWRKRRIICEPAAMPCAPGSPP